MGLGPGFWFVSWSWILLRPKTKDQRRKLSSLVGFVELDQNPSLVPRMANPLFQCSVKNDEIWIKGISYETKANIDLKLLGIKILRFEVIENGYAVTPCHVRMISGWLKRVH